VAPKIGSSPEYVAEHYQTLGFTVTRCESTPLHALFGALLWTLVQDPADRKLQVVTFANRLVDKTASDQVWSTLPEDFGTAGYARRRQRAIAKHLASICTDRDLLLFAFDLGIDGSEPLRQYLWAHRPEDIERARALLVALPPEKVCLVLRYLLEDYWRRFIGWPDLFLSRGDEYLFIEVKLGSDKLSDEQRTWIEANRDHLQLPFLIAKIHRQATCGVT
jgi:hypothetical protein